MFSFEKTRRIVIHQCMLQIRQSSISQVLDLLKWDDQVAGVILKLIASHQTL